MTNSAREILAGVRPEVRARAAETVRLRRDLHRNPEPGFQETRTAAIVAERLRAEGLEVRTGIAVTGILASAGPRYGSGAPAPARRAILFRADMDALPLQEETGAEYASTRPGFMHACGHDAHTAILAETAVLLQRGAASVAGKTVFAFQPAEEGPGGARPMIEAGILDETGVEAVFGLHLWSEMPVGKVGVTAGPAMASADEFEIRIVGKGGHAAFPQNTVDAVVVGSHVVAALQTLVSRNADPLETAVLTVGAFHAGSNFNIIAETATLKGTLRTFDPALRARLVRRLRETVEGVAGALGARAEFRFQPHYPPTVNDPAMAEFVAEIARDLVGPENLVRDLVMMGAEDFSYFLRSRPGCFVFVGAGNEARGIVHPHHSPRFDLDEDAMPIGCELFLRIAERYFERFPEPPPRPAETPWE